MLLQKYIQLLCFSSSVDANFGTPFGVALCFFLVGNLQKILSLWRLLVLFKFGENG